MTKSLCPQCGKPFEAESSGVCAACLLKFAARPESFGDTQTYANQQLTPEIDINLVRAAFPQLEILAEIGRGGMGTVFKARQPKLDRFVALKILSAKLAEKPTFAERFAQEGKLLARLSHPNIVAVYDFGQVEVALPDHTTDAEKNTEDAEEKNANANKLATDTLKSNAVSVPDNKTTFFFLILEFVDGVNLRQAMREERFSPEQALAIVPRICEALQYAHDEGVLHRDIKPENILLDTRGRIKIADFGIGCVARWTADGATAPLP